MPESKIKTYKVKITGCDDSTIVEYPMTDEQYNFLSKFAEQTRSVSTYACMPKITEIKEKRHGK